MSDIPLRLAGEVPKSAKCRAAPSGTEETRQIAPTAGTRDLAQRAALLEARFASDAGEGNSLHAVVERAALLSRRTDVWVKRPATV